LAYLPGRTGIVRNYINTNPEMKNFHFALRAFAFVGLAFFMSSASCELFKSADKITFTADLEHTFNIHEEADNPDGMAYATKPEDEVLDAADVNADFAKNADKIESITINKITYVLSDYASAKCASVGFSNGSFTFSDPDGSGAVVKGVSHPNLESSQGTEHTLTFTQSEADELSNLLVDKKKIRIHAAGDLSCTPLFLKVKAKVNCTITARVL
jgi:hypothetical protein